jgi:peroxiredoxin
MSSRRTLSIHEHGRRTSAVLVILAGLATGCSAAGGARSQQPTRSDFALRDTTGRTVRLSDYLGKQVVLLNFWATWCTPCAAELPQLNKIYRAHKKRGFVVLSIAMDGPETAADVGSVVRRHGLEFPVLLDEETRVVGMYNPKRAAPFNVLIARDTTIAKSHEGYVAGDEIVMEADIVALLPKNHE